MEAPVSAPERLSEAEVAELERLEKAATPWPWTYRGTGGLHMDGTTDSWEMQGPHDGTRWPRIARSAAPYRTRNEDPALIAAARNALPRLLAERRALREALALLAGRFACAHPVGMSCGACNARALLAPQKEAK